MSTFPTSYDNLSNPTGTDSQSTISHSSQHSNANNAIESIEQYIGIESETDPSKLTGKVKRLDKFTTKGDILGFDGTNPVRIPKASNGKLLSYDDTTESGLSAIDPTAGGTVTSTSVVSANGFTGTVANASTTPAITLGTSVTGLLKGNGTAVSSATQGTDYYAPSGTDVAVADGGTGVSSLTAYGVIVGGTTSTAPVQSIAVGTTGQVLTSNGAGASPSMQNIQHSYAVSTTEIDNSNHTGISNSYTVTIPGGIGNGIKISAFVELKSNFFGDYRDDIYVGFSYGSCATGIIISNRNGTDVGYGYVDMIIKATSTTTQEAVVVGSINYPATPHAKSSVGRTTGTVDSTVSQTLNITAGFEQASSTIYCKFHSITIEKL